MRVYVCALGSEVMTTCLHWKELAWAPKGMGPGKDCLFDTHPGLQGLWAEAGTGHSEEVLSQQGFNPSSLLLSCFFLLLHLCKRN